MKSIVHLNTVTACSLRLVACCLLAISLLSIQSCSKKSDPQPETDRVKELLKANTWKIQTVTVDNVDKTSVYAGLTLSFTDATYTTTNGGPVWPASGTWQFADDTGKLITRSDDLSISVEEVTTTKLSLKLTWAKTTLGGGRTASIAGSHLFVFGK